MTLLLADYFVMQDFYIRKSIEKVDLFTEVSKGEENRQIDNLSQNLYLTFYQRHFGWINMNRVV